MPTSIPWNKALEDRLMRWVGKTHWQNWIDADWFYPEDVFQPISVADMRYTKRLASLGLLEADPAIAKGQPLRYRLSKAVEIREDKPGHISVKWSIPQQPSQPEPQLRREKGTASIPAFVPMKSKDAFMPIMSYLIDDPKQLTPEVVAEIGGLTRGAKDSMRAFIRHSGPWTASERLALLNALTQVPVMSRWDLHHLHDDDQQ
jgi:hypothetical protein